MRNRSPKTLMASLALMGTVLAATPSGALSISLPTPCDVSQSSGQVFPAGQAPAPSSQVFESVVGEGVVMWQFSTPQGQSADVVRICRSGQELRVIHSGDQSVNRLTDMAFGAAPYTLRQIETEMRSLGSGTHRTRNTYGSCVCDALGY